MLRPTLAGVQEAPLPPGYVLRHYRPGDETAWADLLAAAYPDVPHARALPLTEFLPSPLFEPERIVFACRNETLAACAAAWESQDIWGSRTGRLHYVATHPEHRRRGLARAVVAAAIEWMAGRYDRAVLVTQTFRTEAVKLYMDMGFEPDLAAFPEMPERWRCV